MWRQQSGVCVCGGQGWWVGRLRGREAVEVTCVKDNEMRHWESENGGQSVVCLPPPGAWRSWTPRWWHIHQRPRLQGPGCGLADSKQGQGMGMTRWGAGNTKADTPCGRSTGDGKEGKEHIKSQTCAHLPQGMGRCSQGSADLFNRQPRKRKVNSTCPYRG